jgi:hypothetical protein
VRKDGRQEGRRKAREDGKAGKTTRAGEILGEREKVKNN